MQGVHDVALPVVSGEPLACPCLSLCGQGLHLASPRVVTRLSACGERFT